MFFSYKYISKYLLITLCQCRLEFHKRAFICFKYLPILIQRYSISKKTFVSPKAGQTISRLTKTFSYVKLLIEIKVPNFPINSIFMHIFSYIPSPRFSGLIIKPKKDTKISSTQIFSYKFNYVLLLIAKIPFSLWIII